MNAETALMVQLALAALAGLLAFALAVGIVSALAPGMLERLRDTADRRVSMRRATRPLDVPRHIDHWFYRHHRVYGGVVVTLAMFLLYFLVFSDARDAWHRLFGPEYRDIAAMLLHAARIVLWMLSVFALMVGTVVLARPSELKKVEAWANRWLTPRRMTRALHREYAGPDTWARSHPRAWGIAVALASGLCLTALALNWQAIAALG